MNREQLISRLVDSGLSLSELSSKSDAYLEARLAARGEPHRDAGVARTPVRRIDAPMDPELAALVRHFDASQDFLENYARADPFEHGEEAAWAAAEAATFGNPQFAHRGDARSTLDAGGDQELARLASHFDNVMSDGMTLNEPPGDTHAERIRSASARVGVNQVLSTEEYWAMSDEQRAAADKILADAAVQIAALRGGQ